VAGEVIALDATNSLYLGTNHSGTVLWKMMAEGATHDELVEGLISTYGITREQATAAVDDFVRSCGERDLLEP
jgi:hypothetical protein